MTTDHLGSPRIITDENGEIIGRKDYAPFGEETITEQRTQGLGYAPPNIRQDFTGYESDEESGLQYAQARYFNPNHGRFTAPDPLMASANAANPQTFNRYIYTGNNPVNYTDPSGLDWCRTSSSSTYWNGNTPCPNGTTDMTGQEGENTSSDLCYIQANGSCRRYAVGAIVKFNADGTTTSTSGEYASAPEQGQSNAQTTNSVAGSNATDIAAGGIVSLPTASGPSEVLSLCPASSSLCSETSGVTHRQTIQRLDTSGNKPLKSVEGIARIFELCSMAPGVGSACAVGAGITRFGQGRFGDAGDNFLNVVPFLGWVRKADKAVDVARGTTVIGHMPDYVNVAKKMGANYLKPTSTWNWRMQGDFIKDVIKRGDDVFIGTSIRKGPSVLKREIKQLVKAGYKPARQGSKWLVKVE